MTPIAQLFPELEEIEDAELRERCEAVLMACVGDGRWADPTQAPFVLDLPAAEFNGVDHVRAVTRLLCAAVDVCQEILGLEVDRGAAIAAGLLHDASKWQEYEPGGDDRPRLSALGRALPHAALGAVEASRAGLPDEVVNAIASHTPQNSLAPRSVLAALLHHLDLALTDAVLVGTGRPSRFKLVLGREL